MQKSGYTKIIPGYLPAQSHQWKLLNKVCSEVAKKTPEQPHWHEAIKRHWCHSGVSIVNFQKIPYLFLAFHLWIPGSVANWVYQQRSKYRQVENMKHARTDVNYIISMRKQVKLQHEKKPVSNLKVCWVWTLSKHFWNLLRFSFRNHMS